MFVIVTGAPGSSKTSHVIDRFMGVKDRPIFYRGIKDLTLPWTEFTDEQTLNWPDHLPDGAVLIVDEAQKLWRVRPSTKPVPWGLEELETHRHRGWDIWFITQEPSLLDSHARKICNEQYHYVRPFGAPFVIEYHSGTGYVNPANRTELRRCNQTRKRLPKRTWGLYKSAEVHTHKFRPPKILFIALAAALVVPVGFFLYVKQLTGEGATEVERVPSTVPHEQPSFGPPGISRRPSSISSPDTPVDWPALFKPEVAGLPYTAPVYREQALRPKSVPVVHGCMSMRADFSDCQCFTQQGTRIADMPKQVCRTVLRDGLFNHLAEDEPQNGARGRGSDAEERGAPRATAQTSL